MLAADPISGPFQAFALIYRALNWLEKCGCVRDCLCLVTPHHGHLVQCNSTADGAWAPINFLSKGPQTVEIADTREQAEPESCILQGTLQDSSVSLGLLMYKLQIDRNDLLLEVTT